MSRTDFPSILDLLAMNVRSTDEILGRVGDHSLVFAGITDTYLEKVGRERRAMAAWWATPIECYSALARLRRENILDSGEEDQARDVVRALMSQWTEVAPSAVVREGSARALLLHPLRVADSFQLSAALVWANRQATGRHFVCLD